MPGPTLIAMNIAGQKQREAVARVVAGETYTSAGLAVGLSRNAVAGACRRAGIKVGFRPSSREAIRASNDRMWSDPERKAHYSARLKRRWKKERAQLRAGLDGYREQRKEAAHA
jgi:hypothetical protein